MVPHPDFGEDREDLLPPGHRVGGWTVTGPIGEGGWATVYAARRTGAADGSDGSDGSDGAAGADADDTVALKVLPTAGLAPRQARRVAETARREAELARTAPHPRLVRLLDTLVLSAPDHPVLDGAIVLVMERARCTLRDLLVADLPGSGPSGTGPSGTDLPGSGPDEDRAGRIVAGICEGLAHLHRSGWAHGDLKPENVLIGEDGEVRLSDFGLAIELTGTHGYSAPLGTPDYLPPERRREPLGEHGVKVRTTADIWALGIVIHEVFAAGVPPFPGATPTARSAAAQQYAEGRAALRLDPGIPPFWRALAADCLATTHAARAPHTAESLLARIRAHHSGPGPGPGRRPRPRPVLLVLAAVLAAATAVAAALWPPPDRPARPGRLQVFNAERGCQDRTDRDPRCSLGLAVDPMRPYTTENVIATRVWHDDVLDADCQLRDGLPVINEEDVASTLWYRIRLPGTVTGWLPAVRTKDRPALPDCP
ncbi:serine/threonine-protein kinase [Kitasatospora cineracea]|uniref:Serine/threonine protein kinase n=1 Tax=Kitasatospora cineracea TaxID=88074 RepID=A0A3N4RSG7_9ACTN|nr:serine/threonine-protein kinase [Kitasatospora cineracea]RPE36352.1 serine/threonine protein kinase [Kitasatospora cineracea]